MRFKHIFTTGTFIRRAKRRARKEDDDLLEASRKLAKEIAFGYALYYGFFLLLVLAALVILGFTELLGGPFVLAQVILFLLAGTLLLASAGLWWLWRKIQERVQSSSRESGDVDVHEGAIVDGRLDEEKKDN